MAEATKHLPYDHILPRIEPIGWLLATTGLAMKYLLLFKGDLLLMVGVGALADFYFLRAFAPATEYGNIPLKFNYTPVSSSPQKDFTQFAIPKIQGNASAVTLIGILFKLLFWKGSSTLLMVGVSIMAVTIMLQLTAGRLARRIMLVTGLGVIAWAVPTETLVRAFYRDDPTLVEKMIFQYHHPIDKASTAEVSRLLHARRER